MSPDVVILPYGHCRFLQQIDFAQGNLSGVIAAAGCTNFAEEGKKVRLKVNQVWPLTNFLFWLFV